MFLLQFCLPEFEKMGLNFSEERCNPADILLDAVSASTWKVLQILRFVFVSLFDFAALLSFFAALDFGSFHVFSTRQSLLAVPAKVVHATQRHRLQRTPLISQGLQQLQTWKASSMFRNHRSLCSAI